MTARAPATGRLPLVVPVLAAGTFLMLTTEFVVAALLPEIAADLRIGLSEAGLLITVFALGMVCAPVMALLTLRVPRRTTLLVALVVFVLGHVVVAVLSGFGVLLVARFVTALATGAFWAVSTVVAREATEPASRSRAVGLISAGGMLATVLGVPLGALVARVAGWQGTFWVLAGAAVLVLLVVSRTVRDGADRHPDPAPPSLRTELAGLVDGRLWLVLAACFFTTGGVVTAYSYVTPFLTDRAGVPAGAVPLVLGAYGAAALLGTLVGGSLGDRRPYAVIGVVPLVSAATLAALLVLGGSTAAAVVLVTVLGLFGLSANPVLISTAVQRAGRAPTLGSGLGVAAFNAGTAAGTALGGMALSTPLGVSGPVATGAALSLVTLVPALLLARRARPGRRGAGKDWADAARSPGGGISATVPT